MTSNSSAYGLDLQARCVAPFYQEGPSGVHRFLVGTSDFGNENKIYLLEYHDQTRIVDCRSVWTHEEEIWGISASPCTSASHSLFTTYSPKTNTCVMHKIGEPTPGNDLGELSRLSSLPNGVKKVLWDTEGLQVEVRTVSDADFCVWKLDPFLTVSAPSNTTPLIRIPLGREVGEKITNAVNDPHHANVSAVATTNGGIWLVDARAGSKAAVAGSKQSHLGAITSVDYSHVQLHRLLSTGEDGAIRTWDVRSTLKPLPSSSTKQTAEFLSTGGEVFGAHNHICRGALYHPNYDQLVLSWGADHCCRLWDLEKPLKEAHTPLTTAPSTSRPTSPNSLGGRFPGADAATCVSVEKITSDFGETVFGAAWSSSGAWVFAAVSFNGKVLVDTVPDATRLRVLMKSQHHDPE